MAGSDDVTDPAVQALISAIDKSDRRGPVTDAGAGLVSGHLLRVTPTRHWLEWQEWAHPVLAHPFEVRSGQLHLPDVPGNGLEWDESAVRHYQVEH